MLSALVDTVFSNGPAAKAGMEAGDRVLSIDGEEVSDFEQLRDIVAKSAGKELVFKVERKGQTIDLTDYVSESDPSFIDPVRRTVCRRSHRRERKHQEGGERRPACNF